MADKDSGILAEFEQFLAAKAEAAKNDESSEDYEVEVWDEKGRGARVRRSHAKPFLQSLGIDLDSEPTDGTANQDSDATNSDDKKGPRRTSGKTNAATGSVARKYFVKK